MARNMTITVTNDATGCRAYYTVEYKLTGDSFYTTLTNQTTDTIVIPNLLDDTIYDYRVTRVCCDTQVSNTVTGTFDTTLLSPP